MYKACSRCGRIHDTKESCPKKVHRSYPTDHERKLRSTPRWRAKSLEVRAKACYLCEVCKLEGRYNYEGVEVHHITKLRDDDSLLLDNKNLVVLCTYHHKLADEGMIDKDFLRDLARKREGDF